jgi:hypothetical protein
VLNQFLLVALEGRSIIQSKGGCFDVANVELSQCNALGTVANSVSCSHASLQLQVKGVVNCKDITESASAIPFQLYHKY